MSNYFISGISSGIGLALAETIAAQGHRVYGLGRRAQTFRTPDIHYHRVDLSDMHGLESNLDALFDECARFDYAILNAAVLGQIDYLGLTLMASLRQQMDVNLWSQKVIIDKLLRHSPSLRLIVAISSGAAVNGGCGWNGYSISKAASKMMIEIYANEHPHTHFISLAPGLVDTGMHDDLSSQAYKHGLEGFENVDTLRSQGKLTSAFNFAEQFCVLLPDLFNYPSGSYLDVRQIG